LNIINNDNQQDKTNSRMTSPLVISNAEMGDVGDVGEVGNITANHNSSNDENINNEENLGFE
jgi:hypothetical protein